MIMVIVKDRFLDFKAQKNVIVAIQNILYKLQYQQTTFVMNL